MSIYKEVVFFLMETHATKVILSYEHVGYKWLDYRNALDKLTFKNAKDILEKANNFLKSKGIIESCE